MDDRGVWLAMLNMGATTRRGGCHCLPPQTLLTPFPTNSLLHLPRCPLQPAPNGVWLKTNTSVVVVALGVKSLPPLPSAPRSHFAVLAACLHLTIYPTNHRLSAVMAAHTMQTDQVSTGEALSFSPSTNPSHTDDSTSGHAMPPYGKPPAGGHAAGVPAASCPIEERATRPASRRKQSKRRLASSSSSEEGGFSSKGKGTGRLTKRTASQPRTLSHPAPRLATSAPSRADALPASPGGTVGGCGWRGQGDAPQDSDEGTPSYLAHSTPRTLAPAKPVDGRC